MSQKPAATPKLAFPYEVEYNDHFETPLVAYQDILPLLDAVSPKYHNNKDDHSNKNRINSTALPEKKSTKKNRKRRLNISEPSDDQQRSEHILYDPYYCNGRARNLLRDIGFTNVVHEKRDFYRDVKEGTVPFYHTLITNPPYSGTHKERIVRYAIQNLRCGVKADDDAPPSSRNIPFFILMPNYVACRDHFIRAVLSSSTTTAPSSPDTEKMNCSLSQRKKNGEGGREGEDIQPLDILYVVPSKPYGYDHPEGTGKAMSPFESIWFCGIPSDRIKAAKDAFRRAYGDNSVIATGCTRGKSNIALPSDGPRLVSNLNDLKGLGVVPTKKRRNPKQRKKEKLRLAKAEVDQGVVTSRNNRSGGDIVGKKTSIESKSNRPKKKQSNYRDENGIRKRRRF